jgi:deoxycytidylate deaminase
MNPVSDEALAKAKTLATYAASKSACKKRKVGACIVGVECSGKTVHAFGYNHNPDSITGECESSATGTTHRSVIHAEVAALLAFKLTYPGATPLGIAVTHPPCENCTSKIHAAGLRDEDIHIVEEFLKFDSAKPRYELIPPEAMEAMAVVLTYGAKKYKPGNFMHGEPTRFVGALYRHLEAYRKGEQLDAESKLPHLAHALTNIAILMALEAKGKSYESLY